MNCYKVTMPDGHNIYERAGSVKELVVKYDLATRANASATKESRL